MVFYKFNKGILKISDKYREGRLTGLEYAAELSLYYMNMEKQIRAYFVEQIDKQMKCNSCLPSSDYKDGLYDALNDVLDEFRKSDN